METSGKSPRISVQEAAASLAAIRDSRRRARRAGYPVWFWLATGIGMAAVPLYLVRTWLPSPWDPVISLASLVLLAATAIGASLRAQRGVAGCGSLTTEACRRELPLFLWSFVPYVAVLLAGGITWQKGLWHAPLAPLATAAAAFAVWTGLGLAATTFSALLPARR